MGEQNFITLIDRITDKVTVTDEISIDFHPIQYTGAPYFIFFHNQMRFDTYGLIMGHTRSDFHYSWHHE